MIPFVAAARLTTTHKPRPATHHPRRQPSMALKYAAAHELHGAVAGTLIFLLVFMCLLTFQSFSKFYILKSRKAAKGGEAKEQKLSLQEVKYYNSTDVLALAGDRGVGNTLEQAVLFLPLFWLNALLVDPSTSFYIALFYSLSRLAYPVLFMQKGFGPIVFISTIPGYAILIYLTAQLVRAL